MDENITISKTQYNKLKQYAFKWQTLQKLSHLDHHQIRRVQYLIKNKLPDQKSKLYSIITQYKITKDIFLLQYIINIYKSIEDHKNITTKFTPII